MQSEKTVIVEAPRLLDPSGALLLTDLPAHEQLAPLLHIASQEGTAFLLQAGYEFAQHPFQVSHLHVDAPIALLSVDTHLTINVRQVQAQQVDINFVMTQDGRQVLRGSVVPTGRSLD